MSIHRTKHRCALLLTIVLLTVLSPPVVAAGEEPIFAIGIPEAGVPEAEGCDEFDGLTWKATESCILDATSSQDCYFPAALYAPSWSPDPRGVSELAIAFSLPEACVLVLHLYRYGAETDCVEFDGQSFFAPGPGEGAWGDVTVNLGPAAAGQHVLRFTIVPGEGDGIHLWDAIVLERGAAADLVTWLPPVSLSNKAHSPNSTVPIKFGLSTPEGTAPAEVCVKIIHSATGAAAVIPASLCAPEAVYKVHFRTETPGTYTATVLLDGLPADEPISFRVGDDSLSAAKTKGKKR